MSARYYSFVESRYGWSEEEIFDRRQAAYYRDFALEDRNERRAEEHRHRREVDIWQKDLERRSEEVQRKEQQARRDREAARRSEEISHQLNYNALDQILLAHRSVVDHSTLRRHVIRDRQENIRQLRRNEYANWEAIANAQAETNKFMADNIADLTAEREQAEADDAERRERREKERFERAMERLKEQQEEEKRMELERDQERAKAREEKTKLKLEHTRRVAEAEKQARALIEKQRAARLAPLTVTADDIAEAERKEKLKPKWSRLDAETDGDAEREAQRVRRKEDEEDRGRRRERRKSRHDQAEENSVKSEETVEEVENAQEVPFGEKNAEEIAGKEISEEIRVQQRMTDEVNPAVAAEGEEKQTDIEEPEVMEEDTKNPQEANRTSKKKKGKGKGKKRNNDEAKSIEEVVDLTSEESADTFSGEPAHKENETDVVPAEVAQSKLAQKEVIAEELPSTEAFAESGEGVNIVEAARETATESQETEVLAHLNEQEITQDLANIEQPTEEKEEQQSIHEAKGEASDQAEAAKTPKAAKTGNQAKAPKVALENSRWTVANIEGRQDVVIEVTEAKQSLSVSNCKDTVVTVKGKISRVLLNSCLGCALIVDDVIATLELVRCTKTQLQINGVVPQVMVDQSQGLLLYLLAKPSWENISIATSQALDVNILRQMNDDEDAELVESAVPVQFISHLESDKLVTVPSEHV